MTSSGSSEYRFGSFRLLPAQRQLLAFDAPVKLGARAFDMLVMLVELHARAVSKRELMDRVWPNVVVEENNLQVQVVALRKVLGPAAIATIPGRGYRFTLPMETGNRTVQETPATPAAPLREGRARSNLPEHLAPLYGRDEDLAAVRKLVREHKLVSIVGAGGIGKTRLALAAMDALREHFADGVWTVDLAPVSDPTLVLPEAARVLGIQLNESSSALDLAVRAVAHQRLVLVLDNCEHLLEAVEQLVLALRMRAPGVHVLVTSQEVLRQADEQVYRLGPLALPDGNSVENAMAAGAIQLFVARVNAQASRLVVTADNVGALVEICRRLDGIPLAIEFAAARVPLLGLEGVRDRLDARFQLLTGGARVALRRHQTLRAALEWSYSLLSKAEQAVFDKLGVFAGSFSLHAAQALTVDDRMDEWAALECLGALVDKSLVAVDASGATRYRMLETTRAFALERLAARNMTAQILSRHAEVVLGLFENFYAEILDGAHPAKAAEPLAADVDNLRSALHWSAEVAGEYGIAIRLFGATGPGQGYLHYVALTAEARHWCELLRPRVDDGIPAEDAARFWLASAKWGGTLSLVDAIDDARRAVALCKRLGDGPGEYRGCCALAYAAMKVGRLDESRVALDQALALHSPDWPLWLRGIVQNIGALVFVELGAFDEARRHALGYVVTSRLLGSRMDELTAISILIEVDVITGELERATSVADEVLARYRDNPERSEDGLRLRSIAAAYLAVGRLEDALAVFSEALPLLRRAYGTEMYALYDMALLLARSGRIDDGARIAAYADGVHASRGIALRLLARHFREQLMAMVGTAHPPDVRSQLYAQGRSLSEEEACALAMPSDETGK